MGELGCVYVRMPQQVKEKMLEYIDSIPDEHVYFDESQEYIGGKENNPHVTVKFGLHTDDIHEVAEVLLSHKGSVKCKLGKTSFFSTDKYHVLKIEIISNDLVKLNKKISDDLEVTDTHPNYNPHATIAYLKKDSPYKDYEGLDLFEGMEFKVSDAVYSKGEKKTLMPFDNQLMRISRIAKKIV